MGTKTLILPFKNESSKSIKVCLEPYCEFLHVQPGQKIFINAICDEKISNSEFVVAYNDSLITIYAPGAPTSLLDVYATFNGEKLEPSED